MLLLCRLERGREGVLRQLFVILLAVAVEILYTRVLYCIQSDIYNSVCYNLDTS